MDVEAAREPSNEAQRGIADSTLQVVRVEVKLRGDEQSLNTCIQSSGSGQDGKRRAQSRRTCCNELVSGSDVGIVPDKLLFATLRYTSQSGTGGTAPEMRLLLMLSSWSAVKSPSCVGNTPLRIQR